MKKKIMSLALAGLLAVSGIMLSAGSVVEAADMQDEVVDVQDLDDTELDESQHVKFKRIDILIDEPVAGKELPKKIKDIRVYNANNELIDNLYPVEMSRVDWYNDWDTKEPTPDIAEAGKSYCVALSLGMNTSVFVVVDSYESVTINGEQVASALWQGYTMLAGKRYPQLPEAQTPVPPVEDNQVPPAEENKPSYEITDGKGAQWTNTDAEGLTFRSTAALDKFKAVKVDGQVVDAKYYALSEGSTVVALKPEYLKTLKAGKHIITIVSEDGEATTEFTVAQAQDVDKEEMKPTGTKPEGNNTTNLNNGSNDTSKTSPKTGDNTNIVLLVASMALAFLGVTTVTGTYKKRNK